MAEQPKSNNTSDEIDLGQLFQIIGRGFNRLGIGFLRLFLYLKKRAFILGGLILLGLGIGYGLSQITEEKKKIEVIVKPNLDSENYLYDVVDEIQNNIRFRDTTFFEKLGIPHENLSQYKIVIEPIKQEKREKDDLEYIQLLEKFKNDIMFSDIVRKELLKNNSLNHRITFLFKNVSDGKLFADKVMNYINSTTYYKELIKTTNVNSQMRIEHNESLIEQIDILIDGFKSGLNQDTDGRLNGTISLSQEEKLDVTGLLVLKNSLIENTERQNILLKQQGEVINVINFGRPRGVEKSFFGKTLILIPSLFILGFFGLQFIFYLNKKSKELS